MSTIGSHAVLSPENVSANLRRAAHPVPGLAGPLLEFDLTAEVRQLRQEDAWTETSRNTKTLVKYPDLRIVLITLKAGGRMEDHQTEGSLAMHCLTGKLRLLLPHQSVELLAGSLLTLERALPHDVEALEDSSFLLTIAWPRGA